MAYFGSDGGPSAPRMRRPPVIPSDRATLGANPPVVRPSPQHPNSLTSSPFDPRPAPIVPPGYANPTQTIQAQTAALGLPSQMVAPVMAQRASDYGAQRLAQLRRIAPMLSPELQAQLGSFAGPELDPAAAWRAISGAFSQFANQQGYQDPRMMLRLGARGNSGF